MSVINFKFINFKTGILEVQTEDRFWRFIREFLQKINQDFTAVCLRWLERQRMSVYTMQLCLCLCLNFTQMFMSASIIIFMKEQFIKMMILPLFTHPSCHSTTILIFFSMKVHYSSLCYQVSPPKQLKIIIKIILKILIFKYSIKCWLHFSALRLFFLRSKGNYYYFK